MDNSIKRGVILAAGYGTRFLPATKTIPKEMLPIIDTPAIEYIVREFLASGVSKILIITSRRKKAVEDYFDREIELEGFLASNKRSAPKKRLLNLKASFSYIRQEQMRGTGDALLLAEDFARDEPFIVAYPDDVILSRTPLTLQLISAFKENNKNVISLDRIHSSKSGRYGVVTVQKTQEGFNIKRITEKPKKKQDHEVMISLGRYLFTGEIFDLLRRYNKDKAAVETLSYISMLNYLAKNDRLIGIEINGTRYDLGEPGGYVKAVTHAALQRKDIGEEYLKYLKYLVGWVKRSKTRQIKQYR